MSSVCLIKWAAFKNPPQCDLPCCVAVMLHLSASSRSVIRTLQWGVDGWRCGWRWSGWWQGEYSLLTLPASALMLFRPTVAPARPCRVPREVREFMALALELAVVPAAGGREEGGGMERGKAGKEQGEEKKERKEGWGWKWRGRKGDKKQTWFRHLTKFLN